MKKQIAWWTVVSLLSSSSAWAQSQTPFLDQIQKEAAERQAQEEQARGWRHANPKLRFTGWTMVILGAAAMIPAGKTYTVFDDQFCVTEYEVSDGRCSTPRLQVQVLAGVIGTGFVLAKIGGRHVKVAPAVTQTQQGGNVTIGW